jgi:hypothetical protein
MTMFSIAFTLASHYATLVFSFIAARALGGLCSLSHTRSFALLLQIHAATFAYDGIGYPDWNGVSFCKPLRADIAAHFCCCVLRAVCQLVGDLSVLFIILNLGKGTRL